MCAIICKFWILTPCLKGIDLFFFPFCGLFINSADPFAVQKFFMWFQLILGVSSYVVDVQFKKGLAYCSILKGILYVFF